MAFGTRPEAIKLAPVIHALEKRRDLETIVVSTGQHRELVDGILPFFKIRPKWDLAVMRRGQTPDEIAARCLGRFPEILGEECPDLVVTQGDTTTALAATLAANRAGVPVAHVEAGLRSGDLRSPFPEEGNRRQIATLAALHFAPTESAAHNLEREGIARRRIFVTGNSSIDALNWARRRTRVPAWLDEIAAPFVLVTLHRRENLGAPLEAILSAVRAFFARHPRWQAVFPVHPNPRVAEPVRAALGAATNVDLVPALPYEEFVAVLARCRFVVSDSGGLQEEAPALGKPLLLLRDNTERPESVASGNVRVVGTATNAVLGAMESLVDPDAAMFRAMARARFPYGYGDASPQIANVLEGFLLTSTGWIGEQSQLVPQGCAGSSVG